ncbi:apolipoprotein N-acyltransferase [Candidatus Saganbacteria bacterium]|nr:apolipoprotein N-acyltransferase [Candidatus Saganbacteria bacterium]
MSILSGILLALCFPKFNLWPLAFVALVPLLVEIQQKKTPREAAVSGFVFGLVFFGINLFWVNTLIPYGGPFVPLGWLLLAAGEALFVALACYLIRRINSRLNFSALVWVGIEYLRSLGIFGITAGTIGYTQAHFLPIAQLASFSTVYGVSFLVVLVNIVLARFYLTRKNHLELFLVLIIFISAFFWGSSQIPDNRIAGSPDTLTITLVQGAIPQERKLDHRYNAENFKIHLDLTRQALKEKPDIIIWPETVVFTYILNDPPYRKAMEDLAREAKAYILTGTPFYDRSGNIYNSIVAFSPSGEVVSRYDKQHLVAFGEYLPFRPLLYPILRSTNMFQADFTPNSRTSSLILGQKKIASAICFESTFSDLLRKQAPGAAFLLTITNDAWFNDSAAPYQHFENGVFRAIENRKYFIQCANTGISGVIDPYGRVIKRTKVFERGSLTFKIPLP